MMAYNLRLALRSLWKKRIFTVINLMGLAIGLSAVLVITAYLHEELSYDRFHEHGADIYRITEEYKDDVKQIHSALNHGPMAGLISEQLSGLKNCVRILPYPAYVSADKVTKHRENNIVFADSTFFEMFSFAVIGGDLMDAMTSPFSVILTKSAALKYFGTVDVVGRQLYYEDERARFTYYVGAVIEDVPQNSHFTFDFLFNMASLRTVMHWFNSWHYPPMYIYVQMEKKMDVGTISQSIQKIADKYSPEEVKAEKRKYAMQPLHSIHLHSSLANEWQANSSVLYVQLFSGIALFLLLIACINFMNLSTAQSAQRAREVGVRKVMGAFRNQLIRQFLGEAFLVSLISLVVALAIAELLLMTFFKELVGKELSLGFVLGSNNIFILLGFLFLITCLAGLYPALYLSRFKTALALKGKHEEGGSVLGLRRALVVFQFFISALLLIGTGVVLRQSQLLQNKQLGFDKQQLVAIKLVDRHSSGNYLQLKNSLIDERGIESAAVSSEIPGGQNFYGLEVNPEGFPRNTMSMNSLGMDEDFISTYKIHIVSGRNFSRSMTSDETSSFILNESAVKFLGWTPDSAIGKRFEFVVYTSQREERKGEIVGVVSDFNYQTLHNKVEPLLMYINKHVYYTDYLTIRTSTSNISTTVDLLKRKWKAFHPDKPLEFQFVNDQLQKQYQAEEKISAIFSSFAILSVTISCMGLFGLSAFSAQRRTKEIGIRKVLGANVTQILKLLSKEYIVMIAIANVLAWPIAYYACSWWLEKFPYRIEVGMEILLATLILAMLIALVTVSIQAVKAAIVNPVKTLRTE
jgi:putative ABC transport system permease protein